MPFWPDQRIKKNKEKLGTFNIVISHPIIWTLAVKHIILQCKAHYLWLVKITRCHLLEPKNIEPILKIGVYW